VEPMTSLPPFCVAHSALFYALHHTLWFEPKPQDLTRTSRFGDGSALSVHASGARFVLQVTMRLEAS
jgi:hypothetical protein